MAIRAWLTGLLLLTATGAIAQAPPMTPAQVAERIDRYRMAPRAPGTYRALAGLGDPAPGAPEFPSYQRRPEQRRLLAQMLGQEPIDTEYWWPRPGMCRTDHALNVVEARIAQLGGAHPYIEQWFRTQRAVFSACRAVPWSDEPTPRAARALPAAMPTDDPAVARLQRDDRAYQAASLLFYRGEAGARPAFSVIARSRSPHAPVARYMLAALHVREEDFYGGRGEGEAEAGRDARVRRALAEAQSILADPALVSVHGLAQGLIGFLGYHMNDAATREAQVDATLDALEAPLGRIERDPIARDRYARAAADIEWLRGRRFDHGSWWLRGAAPAEGVLERAMADQARTRPLAAFLLFPVPENERRPWIRYEWNDDLSVLHRYSDEAALDEAGEAWDLVRDSLSAGYIPEAWPRIDELVREARGSPTDRRLAAIASRFYHQARRALTHNDAREVREAAFREALARVASWPWRDSAHHRELVFDMLQYLVGSGRIAEARQLRDRTDPRHQDYYGATTPILLLLAEDEDRLVREIAALPERGQELLNLLSTDALAGLSARDDLPQPLRARFARVAWTRLYALGRRIPDPLDGRMRALNPQITRGWTSRPGARRTSRPLLLDVLRSPGLNIIIAEHQRGSGNASYGYDPGLTAIDTFEHSDNNWWCAWQPQRHAAHANAAMYDAFFAPHEDGRGRRDPLSVSGAPAGLAPLLRESFLWRSRDEAELAALSRIPSAPQTLAERAIAWRGPGSARGQDEALALAVRTTRYGCQRQGGHGPWSGAAHRLLHQRFPGGEAARRTRWWFDCSHFSGGCTARREEDPLEWERWTWRRYYPPPLQ